MRSEYIEPGTMFDGISGFEGESVFDWAKDGLGLRMKRTVVAGATTFFETFKGSIDW